MNHRIDDENKYLEKVSKRFMDDTPSEYYISQANLMYGVEQNPVKLAHSIRVTAALASRLLLSMQ